MVVHFLYLFSLVIFAILIIIIGYFNSIDFSQILFHLLHIDSLFVVPFSRSFLFQVLFIFGAAYLWVYILVIRKIGRRENIIFGGSLSILAILLFLLFCDFPGFWEDKSFYEDNYASPDLDRITFLRTRKNLIVLYLESVEETYKNKELWGENLLPSLSMLQEKYINLGEFVQLPGTSWTMAAFMASNCGVPIIYGKNEGIYRTYSGKRFNKSICLPDILSAAGYSQYHIIGSDKKFTDFDTFFMLHAPGAKIIDMNDFSSEKQGNFWSHGHEEILKFGLKGWGIRDSVLYEKAKEVVAEAALHQPFYLSIRTLDTHFPVGYLDEACERKYEDYRDVVKCADKMAAEFIHWAVLQEWFADTNILVIGDHLSMMARFGGVSLYERNDRRIFNLLISKDVVKPNKNRVFSTMDIFPTLLGLAGGTWDTRRLGLGTDLLDGNQQTLLEEYGTNLLERKIQRKSFRYNEMYQGVSN